MIFDKQNERVTETTRIISEDEVPPEIREKIHQQEMRHANTVTKIIGVSNGVNVGAMMSAARPKIDKPSETKLQERGSNLMAKFINIGKAGEDQRDERIQDKAKNLADKFRKGLK